MPKLDETLAEEIFDYLQNTNLVATVQELAANSTVAEEQVVFVLDNYTVNPGGHPVLNGRGHGSGWLTDDQIKQVHGYPQ